MTLPETLETLHRLERQVQSAILIVQSGHFKPIPGRDCCQPDKQFRIGDFTIIDSKARELQGCDTFPR